MGEVGRIWDSEVRLAMVVSLQSSKLPMKGTASLVVLSLFLLTIQLDSLICRVCVYAYIIHFIRSCYANDTFPKKEDDMIIYYIYPHHMNE